MKPNVTVTLPGGLWLDGVCHRQAGLRPLTGADEAFLLEDGRLLPPAARATALLARCLTRLGNLDLTAHDPSTLVRSLTVGDREALLLHLRRLTAGERLQCVLLCPDCGEPMDMDLQVSHLLLPPYSDPRPEHELAAGSNGDTWQVRYRLPTGADQEAVVATSASDPAAAAEHLLRRCVSQIEPNPGKLPPVVHQQLAAQMAVLDPQAELHLDLTCPACERPFSALLDAATFLFEELAGRSAHLYRQVHLLAFYYHWSEAEIMGMTAAKRQRYLDLLSEALGEERTP